MKQLRCTAAFYAHVVLSSIKSGEDIMDVGKAFYCISSSP